MRTALSKKDLDAKKSEFRELEKEEEGEPKAGVQSYTEQILKYIPAEVLAFYIPALTAAETLKQATAGTEITSYTVVVYAIFVLGLLGTFLYIFRNAKSALTKEGIDNAGQRSLLKAAISALAFFIWALYIGGPFAGIAGYATYGTLGILGFTFITPAIYDSIPIPFPGTKPEQKTPSIHPVEPTA